MSSPDRPTVAFILSALKSGSTWLNLVLGSLDGAIGLGEFYRPFLQPGHVVCRQCEADGLPDCTLLHGLAAEPPANGFHFVAGRSGCSVLVDASKRLDWAAHFVGRADLDVRLIHLVRHPAGFVDSYGRRQPDLSHDDLLALWESTNRDIEGFIAGAIRPAITVCYDDLADRPETYFPPLCRFLGLAWQPAALRYWEVPHHGLGANGAASLFLRGRPVRNYLTGDDAHYERLAERPTAADRRWRERLPAEFRRRAVASAYARDLRARLGGPPWDDGAA